MMRMFLVILLALGGPATAQTPPRPVPHPDKLEAIPAALQKFVEAGELAGAVAIVGRAGGVIHESAIGLRTVDPATPLQTRTVFRIASMSKPIAAMALMMLVQDGKIGSITDPVEQYLPEFRGQKLAESRTPERTVLVPPPRPITLRDLLTHTSGLPSAYPPGVAERYATRSLTLAETTLVISQQPLEFAPGTKWSYCNAGIDTCGRVVEVVSGQSYEDFLQTRLFRPLQMIDTTTVPTPNTLARLATVYALTDGKLTPGADDFLPAVLGAVHPAPMGGLVSTGPDLARLYRCLLNGGELEGVRILRPESVAELTRTQTGELECGFTPGMSFGLGFAVVRTPQGITRKLTPGSFGHGGAFGTQSWADPTQDVFVILLIARTGLKNGDGSPYREAVQSLAVEAITP